MPNFIGLLITLLIGTGVGLILSKYFFKKENKTNVILKINKILQLSEYACFQYDYSTIRSHKNKKFFIGTEKEAKFEINGSVKLGLNGAEIAYKRDDRHGQILIRMPKIKVLSHNIYLSDPYIRKQSFFNKYEFEDGLKMAPEFKREIEKEVNENEGLFREAQDIAESHLKTILQNLPGIKDRYKIVFLWENVSSEPLPEQNIKFLETEEEKK